MSFVKQVGPNASEVHGFCNNSVIVKEHEELQLRAIIDSELIEQNKLSETDKIQTVDKVMALLSGGKYNLLYDDEYGLCLKYGHIVLYTVGKRAHIRVKGGVLNHKDGLQYDDNTGGLLSTEFTEKESKFLSQVEEIINKKVSYVYINDEGHIAIYCPDVKKQNEVAGDKSPAWQDFA